MSGAFVVAPATWARGAEVAACTVPTFTHVGTTPMFARAGFRRVAETAARSARLPRELMRLDPA